MKLIFFLILAIAVTANAKAKNKQSHEHRQHAAHAHGAGSLGIAFEGLKGNIEFKIPSESILGFEHTAKSDKDKNKKAETLVILQNKISEARVKRPLLKRPSLLKIPLTFVNSKLMRLAAFAFRMYSLTVLALISDSFFFEISSSHRSLFFRMN